MGAGPFRRTQLIIKTSFFRRTCLPAADIRWLCISVAIVELVVNHVFCLTAASKHNLAFETSGNANLSSFHPICADLCC